MEAIRISCAGFPTRKAFDEFVNRFRILVPEIMSDSNNEIAVCKSILEKAGLKGYQIGKTKVFLRAGQMADLDAHRNEVLGRSACTIQKNVRTYYTRKSFIMLQGSAIGIQTVCRGQLARNLYERKRKEAASLTIQKYGRMHLSRTAYILLWNSAVSIQTVLRQRAARNELKYRKETKAAILIQRHGRGHLAHLHYRRVVKAAIATQCACRVTLARRELYVLKMAAKEADALQKQVEELTQQLQVEKRMRVEMEESKTQEISKLQSALEKVQFQLEESKKMNMQEQRIENIDEKVLVAEEVKVDNRDDHEMVNKLTAENVKLKALVTSLESEIDETNKLSEERLKQVMEAESKVIELKTDMQRINEKLSDMETEVHILRQEALLNPGSKRTSEHLTVSHELSENGFQESETLSPNEHGAESDKQLSRTQNERQRENVDTIIKCVSGDLGFSKGKPVAAFTIYKCLLHWKSFEAEKTNVFDRLIQMIGTAIEDETDNNHIAYWLSNTSMLLFLLQKTLKASASSQPQTSQPTSFFGRMFRSSFTSSSLSIRGLDGIQLVEAKYPALLFKQQLTAYVEKIYGILRDNMKRDLSQLLTSCIQVPQIENENSTISPWQSIIGSLNGLLTALRGNYVFPFLIQNIFAQIFSHMNVQLFNNLLCKEGCCTFNNGKYVKSGLAELEHWCGQATKEYVGSSWDELKHVRQAVGFLVLQDKEKVSYDDLTTDLCPVLSSQQLYRICTICSDENNTKTVSSDVISNIKVLASSEDSEDADSNYSYALDENLSIPFSADGLNISLKDIDFIGVKPAEELLENPAFEFLRE
ncbi:unnamed protein product [Cuscuta campestris]|uniref:Dilute domain-containing protein n=1 Tax=Cuscuta campestris TaxID=132261 RepID=A0A484L840_9ASTE|nr:unnamed protein product [Cuscuta campestris]